MPGLLRRFVADAKGQTAIEYGLIVGLIFLVIVGSIQVFAGKTNSMYANIVAKM